MSKTVLLDALLNGTSLSTSYTSAPIKVMELDQVFLGVDTTSGNKSVGLPQSADDGNLKIVRKETSGNTLTITPEDVGEDINNGAADGDEISMTVRNETVCFIKKGSSWNIIFYYAGMEPPI